MPSDFDFKMTDAWWSFDTWIARQIADACHRFLSEGHGHPGDMTEESWNAYVESVREPLHRYAEGKFTDIENEAKNYEDAKAAMFRFAVRFGDWWD